MKKQKMHRLRMAIQKTEKMLSALFEATIQLEKLLSGKKGGLK